MKYNPYSVSKIETFESCKRKFKLQYIDKIKVPDIRYHLEKGKLWHSLIESKIREELYLWEKPILHEIDDDTYKLIIKNVGRFFRGDVWKFINYINNRIIGLEIPFGFSSNNIPLLLEEGFFDNSLFLRGYIDFIAKKDDSSIYIFDWKTGGKDIDSIRRFPKSLFQLEVYSLWAFRYFKNLEKIYCSYIYLEHDYMTKIVSFIRDDIPEKKKNLINKITKIEKETSWEKTQGPLCDYCKFLGNNCK